MESRPLDQFEGLVRRLVKQLDAGEFEYMLTGALAASYYGQPRTTMDVDIILKIDQGELTHLLERLRKVGLEVNSKQVQTTLDSGYNILSFKDTKSPHSFDVILSRKRLHRRKGRILGIPTYYQTPEELILSKLRMIKVTLEPERALKDREDIRSIVAYTKLHLNELRRSAQRESTAEILKGLLAEPYN